MVFIETIRLTDILIVLATFLGPIVAIQIQKYLEERREKRNRQTWTFRILMGARGYRLSQEHVIALNLVPVDFYGVKNVIRAWKAYRDHLTPRGQDPNESWMDKFDGLFADLLVSMATYLQYDFDKVEIQREGYAPSVHEKTENQLSEIREGVIKILKGEQALSMALPIDENLKKEQVELVNLFSKWLKGETRVKISSNE